MLLRFLKRYFILEPNDK